MKKAFLFFAFLFALGMGAAQAQSCQGAAATAPKSCCASKSAAAKAAAADPSIEKRTAEDGSVSYVRRETDAQGNVRFVNVRFDEQTKTFVNVAPPAAAEGMTKKSCSAAEAKACAGQAGAKACAGKAEGKACCAAKKAAVEQK